MRNCVIALVTAALAACGDDAPDDKPADTDVAIAEGVEAGDEQAAQTEDELGGEDDPAVVIGKIGSILLVIDAGEIAMAEHAGTSATVSAVLDYAQVMLDTHSEHYSQTLALLDSYGLWAMDSDTSMALRQQAVAGLATLRASSDHDYDYMRLQVVWHNEAFVVVDSLVPHAPDLVVMDFVANARAMLEAHRTSAEAILRELERERDQAQ
jgi:predicted outer membrane protein